MEPDFAAKDHPLTLAELLAERPVIAPDSEESFSRSRPTNLPDGQTNQDD